MWKCFVVLNLICASAFAAGERSFSRSNLDRALQLAQVFLDSRIESRNRAWAELERLAPRGPVFVDRMLDLIAQRSKPWASNNERRASLLALVQTAADDCAYWPGFAGSAVQTSIHESAQRILAQLGPASRHQISVAQLFTVLDLWDESDLPFVIGRIFSRSVDSPRFLEILLEHFDLASEPTKDLFAERVRGSRYRHLVEDALLYRSGRMRAEEYPVLLRLFMESAARTARRHTVKSVPLRAKIEAVLGEVLFDIHRRLRNGDEDILSAYGSLQQGARGPGRRIHDLDFKEYRKFIEGLWTGGLFDCGELLVGKKLAHPDGFEPPTT